MTNKNLFMKIKRNNKHYKHESTNQTDNKTQEQSSNNKVRLQEFYYDSNENQSLWQNLKHSQPYFPN